MNDSTKTTGFSVDPMKVTPFIAVLADSEFELLNFGMRSAIRAIGIMGGRANESEARKAPNYRAAMAAVESLPEKRQEVAELIVIFSSAYAMLEHDRASCEVLLGSEAVLKPVYRLAAQLGRVEEIAADVEPHDWFADEGMILKKKSGIIWKWKGEWIRLGTILEIEEV
jgi:hypothetical protein